MESKITSGWHKRLFEDRKTREVYVLISKENRNKIAFHNLRSIVDNKKIKTCDLERFYSPL